MLGLEWLAVAEPCGDDFNDPAGAEPGFTDVPRRIFRSHGPGDVSAMADLVVYCQKRDLKAFRGASASEHHRPTTDP